MEPTVISELLAAGLDRAAGRPGAAAIWRAWDDAVGATVARRARPVRLRGRTLVIAVSTAPWMQELHLLAPTVVRALNERLPRPMIDDLYFVLTEGEADPRADHATARPRRCPPPPSAVDLTPLPEPLRRSFDGVLAAWRRRADANGPGSRGR